MSRVLICATPIYGHVAPMITIGRHLVRAGHQVRMLTGSRFAGAVKAAGIGPVPLPARCDYGADIYATFTEGAELTGLRKLRFDIENIFVGVMSRTIRGGPWRDCPRSRRRRDCRDCLHRDHPAAAGE